MTLIDNPIIRKELIQAAHDRLTYIVRAAMPAVALLVMAYVAVPSTMRFGADWRAISDIVRPMFNAALWVQFVLLPLMAYAWGAGAVQSEWTHKTVEILCATPLSATALVLGKYAATVGRLLLVALCLLPVMGVTYHISRLPANVPLAATAITLGAVLFFGAVGQLEACLMHNSKGRSRASLLLLAGFYLLTVLPHIGFFNGDGPLVLVIAPQAFFSALHGSAFMGFTRLQFGLAVLGVHATLAALILLITPYCFHRAFLKHIGALEAAHGGKRRTRRESRRKPLKPNENPFVWLERGAATVYARWAVWVVLGVALIIAVGMGWDGCGTRAIHTVLWVGPMTLVLSVACNCAILLPREKVIRSAGLLILTGHKPSHYMWAKVRAVLWAARYALGALGGFWLVTFWIQTRGAGEYDFILLSHLRTLPLLLISPLSWGLIGMVFGVVARKPSSAVFGMLAFLVILWFVSILYLPFVGFRLGQDSGLVTSLLFFGILGFVMLRFWPSWTPMSLAVLWAVINQFAGVVATVTWSLMDNEPPFTGLTHHMLTPCLTLMAALGLFYLGTRMFDGAMAGDGARLNWGRGKRMDRPLERAS